MNTPRQDGKLRVSVLTPVYNGSEFLETLIRSVHQQDYAGVEHVIIDDGSSDNGATVNILRRYPHLTWKSQKNLGQYRTQNELIKMASGDIVSVICADDLYPATTVLSTVVRHFEASPDLDVVVGRTKRLAQRKEGRYIFNPDPPVFIAKRMVRYTLGIQHCAIFVRRRFLEEKNLYFDPSYKMRGDWDWILRVLGATTRVAYTDEVFAYWRLHQWQTSQIGQTGNIESRYLCRAHGINYLLHRVVHASMNLSGMLCSAYSMGTHMGIVTATKAIISRALRILSISPVQKQP